MNSYPQMFENDKFRSFLFYSWSMVLYEQLFYFIQTRAHTHTMTHDREKNRRHWTFDAAHTCTCMLSLLSVYTFKCVTTLNIYWQQYFSVSSRLSYECNFGY